MKSRRSFTDEMVINAISEIQAENGRVTLAAIRAKIGHGSMTTLTLVVRRLTGRSRSEAAQQKIDNAAADRARIEVIRAAARRKGQVRSGDTKQALEAIATSIERLMARRRGEP